MKVKFRESSELSLLQGAEQSGGEKAVSTAAFFLALQSIEDTVAMPFTCVDEINAGMDGEKMMHFHTSYTKHTMLGLGTAERMHLLQIPVIVGQKFKL